jgi:hypothetical protein
MMASDKNKPVQNSQGSLFEEDFLIRTLGDHVRVPDVALTELVANAWDAGAMRVEIAIPEKHGELLTIADDGCGLTTEQFFERWMKLAYNRQKHPSATRGDARTCSSSQTRRSRR